MFSALLQVIYTVPSFYGCFLYFWFFEGSYTSCPFFSKDLHAKIYIYSLALTCILWDKPHYRHPTFSIDLSKNLRNVAIPGTGLPLSFISYSKIIFVPFILFIYPWICAFGAIMEARHTGATGILTIYRQILVNPQNWFAFWRINSHLVSLHSWKTPSAGYQMENKWDFLKECDVHEIPISPYLKEHATLVIKDRNEEGGMGIFFYKNAAHGGDFIIQDKLENSKFLQSLLPPNAPLSTFRIITASRMAIGEKDIKALSCVFRAGLEGASTDHKSIMFDVDMKTGEIGRGSTTNHWYRLGLKEMFRGPLSRGHTYTAHPDTNIDMTGIVVKELAEMKKLVQEAHCKLMKDVPLCGWDVALTNKGILLLEVNISCNFFRGTFDQQWYFRFLDEYFAHFEKMKKE